MKQIVEETLGNGAKQWRVMTDRCFFDLFHCKWRTDYYKEYCYETSFRVPAVFTTLKEAEEFVYGKPEDKVVERRVLVPKNVSTEA